MELDDKEFFDALFPGAPEGVEPPPPVRPGCVPVWRFGPRAEFTLAEIEHISTCQRCTKNMATLWSCQQPGLEMLRHVMEGRLTAAMDLHLEQDGCLRCRAAMELLRLGVGFLAKPDSIAVVFETGPLEFSQAATREKVIFPTMSLPFEDGVLEVIVDEHDGFVAISAKGKPELAGKLLRIGFWNETAYSEHSFQLKLTDGEAKGSIDEPLPAGFVDGLSGRGMAAAWIEDSPDSD